MKDNKLLLDFVILPINVVNIAFWLSTKVVYPCCEVAYSAEKKLVLQKLHDLLN
jgi:hypothetical protein